LNSHEEGAATMYVTAARIAGQSARTIRCALVLTATADLCLHVVAWRIPSAASHTSVVFALAELAFLMSQGLLASAFRDD
jgi:hypothetical protein